MVLYVIIIMLWKDTKYDKKLLIWMFDQRKIFNYATASSSKYELYLFS